MRNSLGVEFLQSLLGKYHEDVVQLNNLGFENTDKGFIIIALHIDSYPDLSINISRSYLIRDAVLTITNDVIGKSFKCKFFEFNDSILGIINIKDKEKTISHILINLKSKIKDFTGHTISIGVSSLCNTITDFDTGYKEALYSLDYNFFIGNDSIIFFNDINHIHKNNTSYPLNLEREIINSINIGNKESLKEKLNFFFEYLMDNNSSKSSVIKASTVLLFSLYHLMIENNMDGTLILEGIDKLNTYSKFVTIDNLKKQILQLFLAGFEKIESTKSNNKNIQKAIKYIHENYDKNINLNTIADNIYITPSYVSILFKQVLGMNFVEYLRKVRLDKACELLKNNRLKCYEIAYMVGFKDEKYFMQVFKKYFGITPSQYRNAKE